MSLVWKGAAVKRRAIQAAKRGIDKTLSEAVVEAKSNHPGWKNVTGTAEGSIQVQDFAEEKGFGVVSGLWGSVGVNYMIPLEFKRGSALRSAADKIYPRLAANIRAAFRR